MKNIFILLTFFFSGSIFCSQAQSYTIYPTPQKVVEGENSVELSNTIHVICESSIGDVSRNRMEEVLENAGYTIAYADKASQTETNLYLGTNGSNGAAAQYAAEHNLPLAVFDAGDNKFDPYLLQINSNSPHGDIVVLGNSEGSEYYAFATLEQIFEQAGGNSIRQITFEDYSHTQYRGIVEGFYGHPYSVESRLSLFEFCKRFKLNVFVYGPKSDPYHLGNWRDDYPTSLTEQQRFFGMITQDDLRTITQAAKACHVDFIWAAHPGLQNGISFSSQSLMDQGIDALMTKFEHLYNLGVRGFGVFIDDMTYTPSGSMQAYLADQTQKKLRERFTTDDPDDQIAPLFFVPTAYALNYSSSYTLRDLKNVDSEVVIAFTGYDCFSNVRASSINDMASRVGRNPVMWWNNPVNDDHDERIYMREMTTHWTIENSGAINTLNGLILNPMSQAQASKVALFGAADYSWNPNTFDVHQNWEDVFARMARTGDSQTAEALKCFARFSDALVEDDDMIALYDGFKSHFGGETFPAEAAQLRTELGNLNQACNYIESLKDNEYRDYRLIYEDLHCWNAKLKTLSSLALTALDILENDGTMSRAEGWEKYLTLQQLYKGMSNDSAYLVSALEGYGTSTYEVHYEVTPGDSYLRPFVDYLVEKAGSNVPGEWPAKDTIQIVTNLETVQGANLTTEDTSFELSGLAALTLDPDEYIGIYFGNLEKIDVPATAFTAGIEAEVSVNGKQWTAVQLPVSEQTAAYIRLKNTSDESLTVGADRLSGSLQFTAVSGTPTVSTNIPQYQSYALERVIDGNPSSFFWSSEAQAEGQYIMLSYPNSQPQYEITVTFTANDQPSGTVAIEISNDNTQWTPVAEFTAAQLDDTYSFTCNANGQSARYVRFVIRSYTGSYWLQVAEFKSEMVSKESQTADQNGKQIATLADRDLTTSYHPTAAGYIEHRFIENLNIESIEIYHNSTFDNGYELPTIYVNNGSEWVKMGHLNALCTIIDTHEMELVTAVKIEWNEENMPTLYEILPCGTPYVEKPGTATAIEQPASAGMRLYTRDNRLHVQADATITSLTLYDLSGRVVARYTPRAHSFEIALDATVPRVLVARVSDSDQNISTHKIIW
ncbi:beta-N-acetylglucosaminidase domain-containing protein [Barnesiella viscericola]|uniref:beta-N-acetylglucosaminidase domain-containing protein n=1 Tax=Barnesiella viscericola TaxID=397865 RepID=UPI0025A3F3F4|nr:beta-N-acetylglucosaminidase domain-containing protein [Barnesiella viscericola]MDM8269137.1 beta-N-acetylglucosaminidase domain-containing protein [Barnesiella viscericola]